MARSLLLASRMVAAVRSGRSLTQALSILADEPRRARAAAQDAAFGALRAYGQGELFLRHLVARPISDPDIEALLLVSFYRLQTRANRTHVVVDQAVSAAGEVAGGAFKGLVNGVLRNFLRQQESLWQAVAKDDEARHQHPGWWLQRLRRAYPDKWQDVVRVGNQQAFLTLRVNQRRNSLADYLLSLQERGLVASHVGESALRLAGQVSVHALPGFAEGAVSIQDAGAQRAAELLAPVAGERILDACAAPGGKTAHLLELADIELLALDFDPLRSQRMVENLCRLGLSAEIRTADCRASGKWWDGRPFDAVLTDVPCSASGVVRRHPDIKYLRRNSDIARFVALQSEILEKLWPLVRAGGRLLYATCSLFPEENEEQVHFFLTRHPSAELAMVEQLLPQDDHDGFYYALLRKRP